MPSPERSPALAEAEVEEKPRSRGRFATCQTLIPGVLLRTEPGIELDILGEKREIINKFVALAQEHATRKFRIEQLNSKQKESEEAIKRIAKTTEGLRGVESKPDNFYLNVYPSTEVTWMISLLKEALGGAFSSIVHEDLTLKIRVPVGVVTEEGPVTSEMLSQVFAKALVDLGIPEEDLPKMVTTSVDPTVDVEALEAKVESGQVNLPKGAKKTKATWSIKVNHLK